jgi:hypothetical protein
VEMARDLAHRPVLHEVQAMNRGDLLVRQHRVSLYEQIGVPTRWMFFSRWWSSYTRMDNRLINEDLGGS